jgi:hypothetical protein
MTYEQAEMIAMLEYVPEIKIFSQIQQQTMLDEMDAQCGRGRNTPHGDFLYYSGLIEGLKRAGFVAILAEAKVIIKKENEEKRKDFLVN